MDALPELAKETMLERPSSQPECRSSDNQINAEEVIRTPPRLLEVTDLNHWDIRDPWDRSPDMLLVVSPRYGGDFHHDRQVCDMRISKALNVLQSTPQVDDTDHLYEIEELIESLGCMNTPV
uniref:Uncharacterized protein n=1 Tax=Nelumbo nucifera TaxID=4432 RepID=A0A822ZK20_NELNU|nr:TPA_asm: hypothetical protein HUJ06_016381 [Nelumbo nucifera]